MENTKNKTSIRDAIDKLYVDYYVNERYDWISTIKQFVDYHTLSKVYKLLSKSPKSPLNMNHKAYCIDTSKISFIIISKDDDECYDVTFSHLELGKDYKFNVPLNFEVNFDMYDDKVLKILDSMIKKCVLELESLFINKDE